MPLYEGFHRFNPYLIESIGLTWYFFAYLLGVSIGLFSTIKMKKIIGIELPIFRFFDLAFYCFVGAIFGGKIGYALFYDWDSFFLTIDQFPFLNILYLGGRGRSFHGGFIGVLIGCYFFSRKYQVPLKKIFDLMIIGASLGITFGRVGNFLNGELYGQRATESALIRFQFPSEIRHFPMTNSGAIASLKSFFQKQSIDNLKEFPIKSSYSKEEIRSYKEILSKIRMTPINKREFDFYLREILPYRHPSQLYAAFLEGIIPMLLALLWLTFGSGAGSAAALWAACYSGGRFFVGFFREPDPHLGFQLFNLGRGQWLSILLLTVSLFFFFKWKVSCPKEPHSLK